MFNKIVDAWKAFFKDVSIAWKVTVNFFKKLGGKIRDVWNDIIGGLKSGFAKTIQFFIDLPTILGDALKRIDYAESGDSSRDVEESRVYDILLKAADEAWR